jgi:hypothetical protein
MGPLADARHYARALSSLGFLLAAAARRLPVRRRTHARTHASTQRTHERTHGHAWQRARMCACVCVCAVVGVGPWGPPPARVLVLVTLRLVCAKIFGIGVRRKGLLAIVRRPLDGMHERA